MRCSRFAALVAVCVGMLAAELSMGQTLEATLYLPDSLSGLEGPACFAYNSTSDRLYVGGQADYVMVVDGATNRKVARVPVGVSVQAMCWNSVDNKLYCVDAWQGTLVVVDCATNAVVKRVAVGPSPGGICYNPTNNKVYCTSEDNSVVTVIDCSRDSVRAVRTVPSGPTRLCYNPTSNRVYVMCESDEELAVVHGVTDSVVAVVPTPESPIDLCCNPTNNKVYCAGEDDYGRLAIVDAATNSVIRTQRIIGSPQSLCYNAASNKVYCASSDSFFVTVVGGASDAIIGTVTVQRFPEAVFCNPASNRTYCYCTDFDDPKLVAIDGTTNGVVATITLPGDASAFCTNPARNRLYCAGSEEDEVVVVSGATNQVETTISMGQYDYQPAVLLHNPTSDKVYCAALGVDTVFAVNAVSLSLVKAIPNRGRAVALCRNAAGSRVFCANSDSNSVTVINGVTDSVVTVVTVGLGPCALGCNPATNRIYCANRNSATVSVIDGATGALVATVSVDSGPRALCYSPASNRIYCANELAGTVTVINGATNGVLSTINTAGGPWDLAYDSVGNKVYCSDTLDGKITVIDGAADTVLRAINTGAWSRPARLCCVPGAGRLFCADRENGILIIDCLSDSIVATVPGYGTPEDLGYNPADGKVYAVDGWRYTQVIDALTGDLVREVEVGDTPVAVAVSPVQSRVFVADRQSSTISIIHSTMGQDVGVAAITSPSGQYEPGSVVEPTAVVGNYGFAPAGLSAWAILINPLGDLVYSRQVDLVGMAPGDTEILFPPCTLVASGFWQVRCSTFCIGDSSAYNNVRWADFSVTRTVRGELGWREQSEYMPFEPSRRAPKDGAWLVAYPDSGWLFGAKGNRCGDFYCFDLARDTWYERTLIPTGRENQPPGQGCRGVLADTLIYMTKGKNTNGFYRYSIASDSWTQLPDIPFGPTNKKVKGGADLVWVPASSGPGHLYLLRGNKTEFWRYDIDRDSWQALDDAPAGMRAKWDKGSFLAYDGGATIYAHKAKLNELWAFDVPTQTWRPQLAGMPMYGRTGKKKKSGDGAAGAWYLDAMYCLKGGNTQEFWRYTPANDSWAELDTVPAFSWALERKKKVKTGGDLVYLDFGEFYALKGNRSPEVWRYIPLDLPADAGRREGVMATGDENSAPAGGRLVLELPTPISPARAGFVAVRFQLPTRCPYASLVLHDALGRVVLTQVLTGRNGTVQMDARNLRTGVYVLRLDGGGFQLSRKLVVAR